MRHQPINVTPGASGDGNGASSVRISGPVPGVIPSYPSVRISPGDGRSPKTITIGPSIIQPTHMQIEPASLPIWQEKGWDRVQLDGGWLYRGRYYIHDRAQQKWRWWPGLIRVHNRTVESLIENPPPEVRLHPKGPCFMLFRDDWFRVNWCKHPRNAEEAILYIERVLSESVNAIPRR
ncbi:MAG: hypothetical protein HY671_04175 [Chloroflexi bacterium]|nr:hypothetical protein [Chloroflexota bacterium]